jgi:hypothetical protein
MKKLFLAILFLSGYCVCQEPMKTFDLNMLPRKAIVTGSSGLSADVLQNVHALNNELLVNLKGHVCDHNTTTNLLGTNGVFTGGWQDVLDYGVVSISVNSDKASATDGLVIQWSPNSNTVSDVDVFTVQANNPKTFTFGPADRYVRVVYTNGAQAQTRFFLNTILRRVYVKPSSHRINDAIVGQDDAELMKSVLSGENPAGTFVNFKATTAGNFKVSLEEYEPSGFTNNPLPVMVGGVDYVDGKSGVDKSTEAIYTVDYEHHEIHAGSHYMICGFTNLGANVTNQFSVATSAPKELHMSFAFKGTSKTEVYVYEGAEVTGGVSVVAINNNRNSTNLSTAVILSQSVMTNAGTLIYSASSGAAGTTPSASDNLGFIERSREIIMKTNTTYLFRVVSRDTDNTISYCGEWYEHSPKNP